MFLREITNNISIKQYLCRATFLPILFFLFYTRNIPIVLLPENYFDQVLLLNFIGQERD